MKVTKRQLKNIIKEEIEAALSEQAPGPDMAEVEELAATFEKSPVIMDAIEQALQDPKVQAALEKATSMQEGHEPDPYGDAYRSRADTARAGEIAGGVTAATGAAAILTPAFMTLVLPALAIANPIAGLGILGGTALAGIGFIAASKFGESRHANLRKADDTRSEFRGGERKYSDFSDEEHAKLRSQY